MTTVASPKIKFCKWCEAKQLHSGAPWIPKERWEHLQQHASKNPDDYEESTCPKHSPPASTPNQ